MNVVDTGRVSAQRTTVYATVLMALVGGIVTAVFVWAFVRRPVQRLVAAPSEWPMPGWTLASQ